MKIVRNRKGVHKMVPMDLIDANPWRNLEDFPLEQNRLDALKASMADTGVWPRIMVREVGGRYQQVFGHHQFDVMEDFGIDKADVFITDMTDLEMKQALGHENGDGTASSFSNVVNAVMVARDHIEMTVLQPIIDALGDEAFEITEEKVDPVCVNAYWREFFSDVSRLSQALNSEDIDRLGVGIENISKFFNGGIKTTYIRQALSGSAVPVAA